MGKQQDSSFYDKLFSNIGYQKDAENLRWYPIWKYFSEKIKNIGAKKIIDLGCGPGHFAEIISKENMSDIQYIGYDFSKTAIDLAKERVTDSRFTFKLADLSDYDFNEYVNEGENFVYTSTEFFEHVNFDLNIIERMIPNNWILFSVPKFDDPGHVRFFINEDEIVNRYKNFLDINKIQVMPDKWRFCVESFKKQSEEKSVMPKICLCIIAKHEVKTIEKAVESCRPFVDHVLISVDSKSVDGTMEIAKEIADTVIVHEFEDPDHPHGSFAKARNGYLKKAEELGFDWVLYLDGHEYAKPIGNETLHSIIQKNPNVEAIYFDLDMSGTFVRQLRLSKLREDIRFSGDIHNYLTGYKSETFSDSFVFVHDRSEQPKEHIKERTDQRTRMSEEILGKRIEDNPKDSRSMFYLAQSYKETEQFEKAIEMFYRYLEVSDFAAERWNARNYLFHCLSSVGRKEEAYKVIKDSFNEQPHRAEAYIILGDKAYIEESYDEAIEQYQKASQTLRPKTVVFINESAYTWLPFDKLSMAYYKKDNLLDAIDSASYALVACPPEKEVNRIGKNISFWVKYLKERY